MATSYSQFQKKHIDLTPVGLEKSTDPGTYFCTPKGASIIGFAGVDGIHYCFVRGFGEMVFAVSPMNTAPDCAACSALHFEPVQHDIEWRITFHEKTFDDYTVALI